MSPREVREYLQDTGNYSSQAQDIWDDAVAQMIQIIRHDMEQCCDDDADTEYRSGGFEDAIENAAIDAIRYWCN